MPIRPSTLSAKLTTLLAAVIVLGSASVLIAINQISRHQFSSYVEQSDRQRAHDLATVLADIYRERGTLAGVDELLRLPQPGDRATGMMEMHEQMHGPAGRMMMQTAGPERLVLIDRAGEVVTATVDVLEPGVDVPLAQDHGAAITAAGETVGWLLVGSMIDGTFNPAQEQFLRSLRVAVIVSALLVAGLAFVLGTYFLSGVTRPLRALSKAARSIAGGNFSVAMPEPGSDEIGSLTESFRIMHAALEEARRQRELLFRNIAHELRTPLTLLRGEIEAMIDGLYPVDAESLQSLHDETAVLDRLVSDVRSLSNMQSADFSLQYQAVEVGAMLGRLRSALAREASEQNMQIELRYDATLPRIAADPGRLTQVISNLITNAIRHSVTADTIVLSADLQGDSGEWLEIAVRDNGRGVREEHLAHIFERLYRADDARSRAAGGSGLGLAIARQIVEAHGGSIRAMAAPGGGLNVVISIPTGNKAAASGIG